MNCQFIITGCPCSGSHYIAAALRAFGIAATEEEFLFSNGKFVSRNGRESVVDVSYEHYRWLPEITVPVVHLVRHPLAVFNSYLSLNIQWETQRSVDELGRFLFEINEVVSALASYRQRVEDDITPLLAWLKLPLQSKHPPLPEKNIHAHNCGRCNFTWDDLYRHEYIGKLREQGESYGY